VDEWERIGKRRLPDGGQAGQGGGLKDRFGLSWQIVPAVLMEMVQDKDPARLARS